MSVKRYTLYALAALILVLAVPLTARALVLDASPTTVRVGQEVTFTIWAPFFFPTNCMLLIDYGDGASYRKAGRCLSTSCTKIVKHTYLLPGTYTATARTAPTPSCAASGPKPPPIFSRTILVKPAKIKLRVSPNPVRVSGMATSFKNLRYTATSTTGVDIPLHSASGAFSASGRALGKVSTPLVLTLRGGRGQANERLAIPATMLKRARQLGVNSFSYTRTFRHGNAIVATSHLTIRRTSPFGADFEVTAIKLFFDSGKGAHLPTGRPEITVDRNQPNLRVHARLNYVGSGLLRGHWEIDGRRRTFVSKHVLSPMGRLELVSPRVPALPTFMTGTHRVRLVITQPVMDIRFPTAIYFVTAKEFRPVRDITLLTPPRGGSPEPGAARFTWQPISAEGEYLVEFMAEAEGARLFGAMTRKPAYDLPASVIKERMAGKARLFWRVSKFASDGGLVGVSKVREVLLGTAPAKQ